MSTGKGKKMDRLICFDCWVTLWKDPDVPAKPESKKLAHSLHDSQLAATFQSLEPVVKDAVEKAGATLLEMRPEFTQFSETPHVASVFFRMEASKHNAIRLAAQ